jgi:hypothetical protein
MFLKVGVVALILFGGPAISQASEQIELKTFHDVNQKIHEVGERFGSDNVLTVFDTDDTLLVLNQVLGSEEWYEWQNNDAQCERDCTAQMKLPPGANAVSENLADLLSKVGAILSLSHAHPNEPEIADDLRDLQNDGIKAIVLTARGFQMLYVTLRQYTENGITFSSVGLGPNEVGREYLPRVTAEEAERFGVNTVRPVNYTQGIINTDGQHKGVMLAAWLREMNQSPTAIVFVDNESRQTDRVYSVFKDSGIDITTIRYSHSDPDRKAFWMGDKQGAINEWSAFKLLVESIFGQ